MCQSDSHNPAKLPFQSSQSVLMPNKVGKVSVRIGRANVGVGN